MTTSNSFYWYNFYFLNASEADMQEMFMEYCRDMVDDSLMEHQFETIQKDSDYDWYLYHGDWTKRFSSYLDMMFSLISLMQLKCKENNYERNYLL